MLHVIETLIGVLIGWLIGFSHKGVTINVVHKSVDTVDKPTKYHESMAGALPPDVQEYYNTTNGFNKF